MGCPPHEYCMWTPGVSCSVGYAADAAGGGGGGGGGMSGAAPLAG